MFVLYKAIFAGCLLKSQVGVDMNKDRTQKEKAGDRAHKNPGYYLYSRMSQLFLYHQSLVRCVAPIFSSVAPGEAPGQHFKPWTVQDRNCPLQTGAMGKPNFKGPRTAHPCKPIQTTKCKATASQNTKR